MNNIVIYHNADPDGIFSGAIALQALGEGTTCIGYHYGWETQHIIQKCNDANVFMLDVTFVPEAMSRLANECNSLLLIDHHASAKADIDWIMEANAQSNFTYVFEDDQWGAAKKTWEFFNPEKPLPTIIEEVAGYDMFRWIKSDEHRWETYTVPLRYAVDVHTTPEAVLRHFDFKESTGVIEAFAMQGRAIYQYIAAKNYRLASNETATFRTRFLTNDSKTQYNVLAINRDIGGDFFKNIPRDGIDFFVGFFLTNKGWQVSLRPGSADVDLGEIAKAFGGGGHRNAAGFHLKTSNLLKKTLNYIL